MIEGLLSRFGAQVAMVSSSDENHPPENMIDGCRNSISYELMNLYSVIIIFQMF